MSWLSPLWRRGQGDERSLEALVAGRFVAVDLETTGLDPRRDTIVEVAAIPFEAGQPRPGYVTLVNPGRAIPPEAARIHGLTDAAVADAPALDRMLRELDAVCGQEVLVGHGLSFDLAVLDRERRARGLPRVANPTLDTRLLAAALHPDWPDYGLEAAATHAGIGVLGRHTAEGDALATAGLLMFLLEEAQARGLRTLSELIWLQETATHRL